MRRAQVGTAPQSPDPQGLRLCERRKLRRQGSTDAEIEFMNALAEIRNFCEREDAMRRARARESA